MNDPVAAAVTAIEAACLPRAISNALPLNTLVFVAPAPTLGSTCITGISLPRIECSDGTQCADADAFGLVDRQFQARAEPWAVLQVVRAHPPRHAQRGQEEDGDQCQEEQERRL